MKKLVVLFILFTSLLWSSGFYDSGKVKGVSVEVISDKTLIEGDNKIRIKLTKDGKTVKNAKVKIKFFMPQMPGMPYMEFKGKTKLVGDEYKTLVNFSMGGTWQYHVLFKIKGKKYRYRGSVNLGQASSKAKMKCAAGKCGGAK